jgi:hypothetical protein
MIIPHSYASIAALRVPLRKHHILHTDIRIYPRLPNPNRTLYTVQIVTPPPVSESSVWILRMAPLFPSLTLCSWNIRSMVMILGLAYPYPWSLEF